MSKTPFPKKLQDNPAILAKVKKLARESVTKKAIFDSIQNMQFAPKLTLFYKKYGPVIDEIKAEIDGTIGSVITKAAKGGDLKAAQFYLSTRGGWTPKTQITTQDPDADPEENSSAVETLTLLLIKE